MSSLWVCTLCVGWYTVCRFMSSLWVGTLCVGLWAYCELVHCVQVYELIVSWYTACRFMSSLWVGTLCAGWYTVCRFMSSLWVGTLCVGLWAHCELVHCVQVYELVVCGCWECSAAGVDSCDSRVLLWGRLPTATVQGRSVDDGHCWWRLSLWWVRSTSLLAGRYF